MMTLGQLMVSIAKDTGFSLRMMRSFADEDPESRYIATISDKSGTLYQQRRGNKQETALERLEAALLTKVAQQEPALNAIAHPAQDLLSGDDPAQTLMDRVTQIHGTSCFVERSGDVWVMSYWSDEKQRYIEFKESTLEAIVSSYTAHRSAPIENLSDTYNRDVALIKLLQSYLDSRVCSFPT